MSLMADCPMKDGRSAALTLCLVRSRKLFSECSRGGPDPDSRVGRPAFESLLFEPGKVLTLLLQRNCRILIIISSISFLVLMASLSNCVYDHPCYSALGSPEEPLRKELTLS